MIRRLCDTENVVRAFPRIHFVGIGGTGMSGIAEVTLTIGYEVSGKTLIGGRLLEMGYDAPTRSVVVRFDAIRTERGGPITTRRFEARVADVKPQASKVGPALNQAANDVARQVADWVKAQ